MSQYFSTVNCTLRLIEDQAIIDPGGDTSRSEPRTCSRCRVLILQVIGARVGHAYLCPECSTQNAEREAAHAQFERDYIQSHY